MIVRFRLIKSITKLKHTEPETNYQSRVIIVKLTLSLKCKITYVLSSIRCLLKNL